MHKLIFGLRLFRFFIQVEASVNGFYTPHKLLEWPPFEFSFRIDK